MQDIIDELYNFAQDNNEVHLECEVRDELVHSIGEIIAHKAIDKMTSEEVLSYALSAMTASVTRYYRNARESYGYGTPHEQLEELWTRLNDVERMQAIIDTKKEIIKE